MRQANIKMLRFIRRMKSGKPQSRSAARVSQGYKRPSLEPQAPARRSARRVRLIDRIDRRFIFIAAGVLAVAAGVVALAVTLSPEPGKAMAGLSGIPPEDAEARKITLAMPAYAPLSISQGITAQVVKDVQQRLMDLGYIDDDEPSGVYDELTAAGIKQFQTQSGLTASGEIDQQTYDALFAEGAQEYTLSLGMQDTEDNTDVAELQQRLHELGYLNDVTGIFDQNTEDAVKKFQKMNKLPEDGKVDNDIREALYSEDVVANAYSYGEESPEILTYQQRLKELGYLTTEPDGKFGSDTKAAVRLFQESAGLIADGYIGPATKDALMSADAQKNALSIGAKGNVVTTVQKRLKELKYISKVTGYFGTETDSAVRSFQNTNRLAVDGKVGPQTMGVLMSDKAKKSTGVNISGANASSLISVANSKRGSKYVRGAKGPDKFDCSGFVYWCLNKVGVKQGYMTSHTWANSSKYKKITKMGDLKKGDIIVYNGHVAICAGGGVQIDASSHNGKVVKRRYTGSSYWSSSFICGFRIF
jgi:peptidoglycan hydrolase-like protein with peptidoglycan-binding domain